MIKLDSKLMRPFDIIFLFKPTRFFAVWILILAGYSAANFFSDNKFWWSFEINWPNVISMALITLLIGCTFIMEQLQLLQVKIFSRFDLVGEDLISLANARKLAYSGVVVSLVGLVVVKYRIALVALVLFGLWGVLLLKLQVCQKRKTGLWLFAVVIGTFLLFLTGWISAGKLEWTKSWFFFLPYLFSGAAVALMIEDVKSFKKQSEEQIQKLPLLTKQMNHWFAFAFLIAGFALGMITQDPVITVPVLLSFPLYVILMFKPTFGWRIRVIRYPILFLGLMLCVEFPLFFLVLLVNYYFSRFYYVSKFNYDYPSFHIEEHHNAAS
jgi:hypothetical protein